MPDGRFRMWYKDEGNGSVTYAADSSNLYDWQVVGPILTHREHEGANVFRLKGYYWMIIDEWQGQAVYRSDDLEHWERNGLILDGPGSVKTTARSATTLMSWYRMTKLISFILRIRNAKATGTRSSLMPCGARRFKWHDLM